MNDGYLCDLVVNIIPANTFIKSTLIEDSFTMKGEIVLIIIIFSHVVSAVSNLSNHRIIGELFRISFPKTQCIYFICDESSPFYLLTAMTTSTMQFISVSISNINILKTSPSNCQGYILVPDNIKTVENLFSLHSVNIFFQPHVKVLLFLSQIEFFIQIKVSTELHNLDVVIISENTNDSLKHSHSLIPEENPVDIVPLFYGIKINKNVSIERKYLKRRTWSPQLILSKYNQTFSVISFDCPPFVMFDEKTKLYDGVEILMLNEILKNWPTNFTFIRNENNSNRVYYNDTLKQVVDNKQDLALCSQWLPIVYRKNIERSVDFSIVCRKLLVARSELLPNFYFIFQTFHNDLWVLCFATLTICAFTMHLISNVLNKLIKVKREDVASTLLHVLRLISMGPVYRIPHLNRISMKLFLTVYFTFCIWVTTYYSAGLTNSLRFPRFRKGINTLQDIIDHNIKWLDADEWMKNWMLNTTNQKLRKLSNLGELCTSVIQRNEKLRKRNYGVFVQTSAGTGKNYLMFSETLDEFGKTNLKIINEDVVCFYVVFPLKKHSPYVDIFNKAIFNFIEFGFLKHWTQKIINKPQNRFMKSFYHKYIQEIHQEIDLEKLQGAFYFLIFGYLTSLIAFCIEHVINKII
jgi:hypothetical protein